LIENEDLVEETEIVEF
jgi:hypothetical protein